MLHEVAILESQASYQQWISSELFSFGWFFTIGVLIIFYTVWFKLVDKSKLRNSLLLGSLSAVGFMIADMILMGYYGVAGYNVRLFPLEPPVFIVSITKAPILLMLVYQYTSSWRGYALWSSIAMAFLAFGLFPIYSLLGIYELYKWNYFYQFLLMLTGGMIARGLLLLIISIEESQTEPSRVSPRFSGLQPVATKPLYNNKEDNIDNDDQ